MIKKKRMMHTIITFMGPNYLLPGYKNWVFFKYPTFIEKLYVSKWNQVI